VTGGRGDRAPSSARDAGAPKSGPPAGAVRKERGKRAKSKGAEARAELEKRIAAEQAALHRLERALRRLGPEGAVSEPADVTRKREALRRLRTGQLFKLERLQRRLANQGSQKLARNAPGLRHGIRKVVAGGAPGLGKRS
jgi:hypothetical protein